MPTRPVYKLPSGIIVSIDELARMVEILLPVEGGERYNVLRIDGDELAELAKAGFKLLCDLYIELAANAANKDEKERRLKNADLYCRLARCIERRGEPLKVQQTN